MVDDVTSFACYFQLALYIPQRQYLNTVGPTFMKKKHQNGRTARPNTDQWLRTNTSYLPETKHVEVGFSSDVSEVHGKKSGPQRDEFKVGKWTAKIWDFDLFNLVKTLCYPNLWPQKSDIYRMDLGPHVDLVDWDLIHITTIAYKQGGKKILEIKYM